MSVVCPSGHSSDTTDYCDQCGAPIAPTAAPPSPAEAAPELEDADIDTSPAAVREPCPACGAPRSGDDRYCEACGNDFCAPPRPKTVWEVVVCADLAQFERVGAPGVAFPTDFGDRHFVLDGAEMRIGRSRGGQHEPTLEIDLAGTPEDPGISRLHAILERQGDGSYALRDLGSTNGTMVNDDPAPVGTDAPVALAEGDRIRIGAWTAITLRTR